MKVSFESNDKDNAHFVGGHKSKSKWDIQIMWFGPHFISKKRLNLRIFEWNNGKDKALNLMA
jgi:hypothetical protein